MNTIAVNYQSETTKIPINVTRRGAALALAAAGVVGGVIGADIAQQVAHDNHHNAVVKELSQPAKQLQQDIKQGKVSPTDYAIVHAPASGLVANVAADIVGDDHNSLEVQDIMSAQTNHENTVTEGETFYLPTGDVPSESISANNK